MPWNRWRRGKETRVVSVVIVVIMQERAFRYSDMHLVVTKTCGRRKHLSSSQPHPSNNISLSSSTSSFPLYP